MTNHWRDIKNADVILINGANPAEAHPVGFQWFMKAKLDPTKGPGNGGGAKIIHTDPRFSRTSAVSDMYLRIRTGTDVAYYGGLMNYVLQNNLQHADYVAHYTNASWIVKDSVRLQRRPLHRLRPEASHVRSPSCGRTRRMPDGFAHRDMTLQNPALRLPTAQEALFALHARSGADDHGDPQRRLPQGRADRRRDGPSGQSHDDRLRGRPHASHDGHLNSSAPARCCSSCSATWVDRAAG